MLQIILTLAIFVILVIPMGKYMYHIATNKRLLRIKFLTRLIAASIKFVELRAKIWDGRNMH